MLAKLLQLDVRQSVDRTESGSGSWLQSDGMVNGTRRRKTTWQIRRENITEFLQQRLDDGGDRRFGSSVRSHVGDEETFATDCSFGKYLPGDEDARAFMRLFGEVGADEKVELAVRSNLQLITTLVDLGVGII